MRVLVTGATGFVGRQVVADLIGIGATVRAAIRRAGMIRESAQIEPVLIPGIDGSTDWSGVLDGIDSVVHLAAHVHDPRSASPHLAELHHNVNTCGTEGLATQAARMGVRRFVFVSTIKAMGEHTTSRPFAATDQPAPEGAYGRSKWEGEKRLWSIAASSALEVVVIRPPLVYGPGVRANFLAMLRWVDRGWPLPLAALSSQRSMINVWNLSDLLLRCIRHPHASGQVFLASDGEDQSIPELLRAIASTMNRDLRLLYVPTRVLELGATAIGLGPQIRRLVNSLQVDVAATCSQLDWTPPVSFQTGLTRTIDWYLTRGRAS